MKHVICQSGLRGTQEKLQDRYVDEKEFKEYAKTWGIHTRLGFKSMKSCWTSNPTIQSSVNPEDLAVVYFHVIETTKGLRIKESTSKHCKDVKNSRVCFTKKEDAQKRVLFF